MDRNTTIRMAAFVDELQKQASPLSKVLPWAGRAIQSGMGGHYGRQLATGAALGGATGYLTADPENKFRNTLIGAGIGTGAAGARILAMPASRADAIAKLKNLGWRQKYHLTGKGLEGTEAQQLATARERGLLHDEVPKLQKELMGVQDPTGIKQQKLEEAIAKAQKATGLEEQALLRGEYSAPGVLHSAISSPGQFLKNQWQRNPPLMKAFTGLGAYSTAKGFAEKPEEGGPGRFEKGLGSAGMTAGWLASPHSFFPGMIAAPILGKAGKTIGKGIDWAAGTRTPAQPATQVAPEPAGTLQQPVGGV